MKLPVAGAHVQIHANARIFHVQMNHSPANSNGTGASAILSGWSREDTVKPHAAAVHVQMHASAQIFLPLVIVIHASSRKNLANVMRDGWLMEATVKKVVADVAPMIKKLSRIRKISQRLAMKLKKIGQRLIRKRIKKISQRLIRKRLSQAATLVHALIILRMTVSLVSSRENLESVKRSG